MTEADAWKRSVTSAAAASMTVARAHRQLQLPLKPGVFGSLQAVTLAGTLTAEVQTQEQVETRATLLHQLGIALPVMTNAASSQNPTPTPQAAANFECSM